MKPFPIPLTLLSRDLQSAFDWLTLARKFKIDPPWSLVYKGQCVHIQPQPDCNYFNIQSIHSNADLVESDLPRNYGSSEGIYANVGRDQEPFMLVLGLIV